MENIDLRVGIPSKVESLFHKDDTNDNSDDYCQRLEQRNEERAFLPDAPRSYIEPACYVNDCLQRKSISRLIAGILQQPEQIRLSFDKDGEKLYYLGMLTEKRIAYRPILVSILHIDASLTAIRVTTEDWMVTKRQ